MKFNLTITEMNEEEFAQVAKTFNIAPRAEVSENDIVLTNEPVEGDFEEPAPYEPAYDKNGLPWDARIHSSNHKLTDKGVWQRRRGITDIEFERVKNELLGVQAPVVAPTAPVISEPTSPVAQVQPQVIAPTPLVTPDIYAPVAQVAQPMAPVAPVAPVAQPTPVAPTTPDANVLFQTMFEKVKQGMASGTFKANDVQALVAAVNIQFGTQYQTLASVKDNAEVLQFIINDLNSKGL